jgi:uncharacterized lipoprotein YmbA
MNAMNRRLLSCRTALNGLSPKRGSSWRGVVPLMAAALAGCAAAPLPPVLLTLPPAVTAMAPPAAPATTAAAPLLAIRRVHIPEYLVSRRVRFRADASTLAEWPNTYWAERIEIGVSREFVAALRQQLPGWALCDATCGDQPPSLALQVDLVPMDFIRSTRRLQARARVTVSSASASPRVLQTQELLYDLPADGDTPQAQAQAMTELIRQLAVAVGPLVVNARP